MQGEKRYEAGKSILLLSQGREREKRERERERWRRESHEILRFLFSKGELGVSLD